MHAFWPDYEEGHRSGAPQQQHAPAWLAIHPACAGAPQDADGGIRMDRRTRKPVAPAPICGFELSRSGELMAAVTPDGACPGSAGGAASDRGLHCRCTPSWPGLRRRQRRAQARRLPLLLPSSTRHAGSRWRAAGVASPACLPACLPGAHALQATRSSLTARRCGW